MPITPLLLLGKSIEERRSDLTNIEPCPTFSSFFHNQGSLIQLSMLRSIHGHWYSLWHHISSNRKALHFFFFFQNQGSLIQFSMLGQSMGSGIRFAFTEWHYISSNHKATPTAHPHVRYSDQVHSAPWMSVWPLSPSWVQGFYLLCMWAWQYRCSFFL